MMLISLFKVRQSYSKWIQSSIQSSSCLYNYDLKRWHFGHGHSHEPVENLISKEHHDAAKRITWLGIWANIGLSGMKGIAGITFHSAGLLADAVHSISDLLSDGVTLAAVHYCQKQPDPSHPYGYGKYETIGTLAVASLLSLGAIGIIIHSTEILMHFFHFTPPNTDLFINSSTNTMETMDPILSNTNISHSHDTSYLLHPAALGVAGLSIVVKEALYRSTVRIGKEIDSSVLIANAWHHRSDAFTSVVALGGIGLSLLGFPALDPIAGLLVGGVLLKTGLQIGLDATRELADAQLSNETIEKLYNAIYHVQTKHIQIEQTNEKKIEIDESLSISDESCIQLCASFNHVLKSHQIKDMNQYNHQLYQYHGWHIRNLRGRRIGRHLHVDVTIVINPINTISLNDILKIKQSIKNSIQQHVPNVKDIVIEIAQQQESSTTLYNEESELKSPTSSS